MEENKHSFNRSLGLLDATMLVAGSMIGSGIFIVSADMSRLVGSAGWLLTLWIASGIITLMAALSYGELAGMMPKAGGQFVYIQRAYGNFISFLYGWSVFTVIQSGVIAAVAVAFAKYSAVFFPALSPENILFKWGFLKINAAQLFAIASIFLLTYINTKGIKNGKLIQLLFTGTKILALLALIAAGFYVGLNHSYFSANMATAWEASTFIKEGESWILQPVRGMALVLVLGTAMIGALFSSDAWNNVTFIAGEIKEPQKNIPRSLILGTGIVTLLYLLANISYLTLLPLHGSPNATETLEQGIQFAGGGTDRVGTAAASVIMGNVSVYIMALLIIISTFGCNNGIILAGARVYYAMANENLFFKGAASLNKNQVPEHALWVQALWSSLLCLSGTYSDLLDYTTFTSLLFYIITIAGIFVLRKKEPQTPRPYKVLAYPILPIVYILAALSICLILLYTKPYNTWSGLFIVLLGIPFYFLIKKRTDK